MSELTDKLRVTRGKGYYTVLKQILAECGQQIIDDANIIKATGKLTVLDIGRLAVKYDLNLKATAEWLEENRALPTGTYQRLLDRGLKAREILEAAKNNDNANYGNSPAKG
jgi:hypothetical protein